MPTLANSIARLASPSAFLRGSLDRAPAPRAATRAPSWMAQPLSVDENGAPVTFAPARWLVCFVPGLRPQAWHRFVHETHKHVLMLKPNGDGTWTLFEPWWTRLLVRTISTDQAVRFLHWAAMGDALLAEEHVPGGGSQFRGWSNCVSLATFVLGRDYCIWSPNALFKRMRREERTQVVDVSDYIDRYVAEEATRLAGELSAHLDTGADCDLRHVLIGLGRTLLRTSTSPRWLGLFRAAVSQAGQFPAMARTLYRESEAQICERLAQRLVTAGDRRLMGVEDCRIAASQFLGMIRGDLFMRVMLGLRDAPSDREIDQTVSTAVNAFVGAAANGRT